MATTYHTELQKLYVAYFTRPADPKGLEYWETAAEAAGGDLTAISAAFATSAEYKAAYDGKTNEEVIDQIYQNLFGRPAEAAGKAYWAQQITNKALTIDQAVKIIGDAALTTDKVAFTNKVKAAEAFTGALDTPAEVAGYAGEDALVLAREFVAGVTTDASYAAAVTPSNLNAVIADVVHAGTPFTLLGALGALDTALEAKADFLVTADGDDDEDTSATDADIAAAVTAAETDVDGFVTGYAAATTAVKAALLADEQKANTLALAAAEKAYTAAVVAAGKVEGLNDLIATLTAATTAQKAAADATVEANITLAAAEATIEARLNPITVTVAADGTVTDSNAKVLIELKDGDLVLATGVTEANTKGITALLNASIAVEAAQLAEEAADEAVAAAEFGVDVADVAAGAATDALDDVGQGMTLTIELDAGELPTAAQITAEIAALAAAVEAAAPGSQAETDALAAQSAFDTLVAAYKAADTTNPLATDVTDAAADVETAQGEIDDLAEAVVALNEAQLAATKLAALDDAIDFAKDTFTANDYKLPVTLGAAAAGTAGNDIFLTAEAATTTLVNFGVAGEDILYIGSGYKLNTTGDATKGVNTDLEVFFVKSGTGTKVVVETSAFGSNASTPEVLTITLTGVAPTELKFENGIITHA